MGQILRDNPEALSESMALLAVLGGFLAAIGSGFVARATMGVQLHKGLILGILAVLVYQGVFVLVTNLLLM
jgi:hypothetical protein